MKQKLFGLVASITFLQSAVFAQVAPRNDSSYPIAWTSDGSPSEQDLATLSQLRHDHSKMEDFVNANPNSPWAPSMRNALATAYRQSGRNTLALQHWGAAWQQLKDSTNPFAREEANHALAGQLELLSSLGRIDTMHDLLVAAQGRTLSEGNDRRRIEIAREAYSIMVDHPSLSYRCGSLALANVARLEGKPQSIVTALIEEPSTTNGISLARLVTFLLWPQRKQRQVFTSITCLAKFKFNMKTFFHTMAFVVAFAVPSAMGQGTMIVDQQSISAVATVSTTDIFQSFTPSLSAINFIQIQAYNPGQQGEEQFYVNLLSGSTTGPVIGTSESVNTPVYYVANGWSTLIFPNTVALTPGDQYFIQPIGQGTFQPLDFVLGNVPYAGGNLTLNGASFSESMAFTEGIIVPEPSVSALTAMGALAFLIIRRMRARTT